MNIHLLILMLAFVGEGIAFYLFYERTKKRPPVCVIGSGCETVWKSPYSKTCGIGNDVWGIIFYTTVAILEAAIIFGCPVPFMDFIEKFTLAIGALISCYFVYLEARVICAWCFWCTLSAFLTWGMATVRFIF